jgi:hypothetical protein
VTGLRVIACASFRRDGPSELHDLARALRGESDAALDAVVAMMLAGLEREALDIASAPDAVLVPMAGHLAGTISGPAKRLVDRLGSDRMGPAAVTGLRRISDAPKAADAHPRDVAAEASTLQWGVIPGDGPILLVDDVVHTGASLDAAWLAAPARLRGRLVAVVAFRALD